MSIFYIYMLSHLIWLLAVQANCFGFHSRNLRQSFLYSWFTIFWSLCRLSRRSSYPYLMDNPNNWKIWNLIEIRNTWRFVLDLFDLKIFKLKTTAAWNVCRRRAAPVQEHDRNCDVILMESRTNRHVFLIRLDWKSSSYSDSPWDTGNFSVSANKKDHRNNKSWIKKTFPKVPWLENKAARLHSKPSNQVT